MELHFYEITTAPTPAATVILLRAGQGSLEVLLQKRHNKMDVLAGAYVFPGGKVDPEDYNEALQARLDQTPVQLAAHLAQADIPPALAAALHVAALRELLEESTILLDHDRHLQHIDTLLAELKSGNSFAEAITSLGLPLTTATLKPWSRWITPKRAAVTTKRFDTFFLSGCCPKAKPPRMTTSRPPTACVSPLAKLCCNTGPVKLHWHRPKS